MTPAMTKLPRFVYGDQEHKRAVADETRNYKFNNRQFCGIKVLQIPCLHMIMKALGRQTTYVHTGQVQVSYL